MQNWASYLENEEGKEVIRHDYGLIAFQVFGRELMVTDFFVDPERREEGLALKLAIEMQDFAIGQKCNLITCNVYINQRNKKMFARKVELFTEFGFLPESAENNTITMVKKLGE